jgi:hypothetical protein
MVILAAGKAPVRTFKGIYEIYRYLHELAGEDESGTFEAVPDTVPLAAVRIEVESPALSFSASGGVSLKITSRDLKSPSIQVRYGVGDVSFLRNGDAGCALSLNVFKNVRRLEEYELETDSASQTVVVAYGDNVRVIFLKSGGVGIESGGDSAEVEELRHGLEVMTKMVADLTRKSQSDAGGAESEN